MNIFDNPQPEQWPELLSRSGISTRDIRGSVSEILARVKTEGDDALRDLTSRIDHVELTNLRVEPTTDHSNIPAELREAIDTAFSNIELFHRTQCPGEIDIETMPGVRCVQRSVPIQSVGLYIPGGSAPLFSTVLMLAIPAMVAGCPRVTLCSPPPISPVILYAAARCGVRDIFAIGGAMAIGAMAYGTQSVPKVDKIFGPGNQWVTQAKEQVSQGVVAIDMPAGPSEVMILADGSARAEFVAADMLSQAEHGADSQAIAVCDSMELACAIVTQVEMQVLQLTRRETAVAALENCRIIVLADRDRAIAFANEYAAEHLIISMSEPWHVARRITAAGSVFIGNYSPESVGDYSSGTNHTLPTYGWARSHSGVNLDSFMRKITYQELTIDGLKSLAGPTQTMARYEGLTAHAEAVKIRL